MILDIGGSGNQGRAIVQRRAGDSKNVVLALSPSGGKASATFGWDLWKNRFGEIEPGTEFDVSIAVWSSDAASAHRVDVAMLTFINGPASAPVPGKVPLATRITEALASMSLKPEILHVFLREKCNKMSCILKATAMVSDCRILPPTPISLGNLPK